MVFVPLSRGEFAVIDDDDWPLVSLYNWHFAGRYAESNITTKGGRRSQTMHRLLLPPKDARYFFGRYFNENQQPIPDNLGEGDKALLADVQNHYEWLTKLNNGELSMNKPRFEYGEKP